MARIVNPECIVTGISINTSGLGADEAKAYLSKVEKRMGLPTVDPFRSGAERLIEALA